MSREIDEPSYPVLSHGTTEEDFREAMWVLERQQNGKATTWIDLVRFSSGTHPSAIGLEDYEDPDDIPLSSLVTGMHEYTKVSHKNRHVQDAIAKSSKNE